MATKNKKRTLFIKNLKKYRIDNDLSSKDMADKLGIPKETYKFYENGIRKPKAELLEKIIEICGFDYSEKDFVKDYKKAIKSFCKYTLEITSSEKIEDDDLLTIYKIIKKYRKAKCLI